VNVDNSGDITVYGSQARHLGRRRLRRLRVQRQRRHRDNSGTIDVTQYDYSVTGSS
jgi:hypothetical protein